MDETLLQQRIDELQNAHWRTVKAAANAVGIESIPDGEKWTDYAEEIAQKELEDSLDVDVDRISASPADDDVKPVASVEQPISIRGIYPTEFYRANNIPFCKLCGEKYLTGGDGRALCPEDLGERCPRINGGSPAGNVSDRDLPA